MPAPQTPPPDSADDSELPETEIDSRAQALPDSQAVSANISAAPTLQQPHTVNTSRPPDSLPPVDGDWLIGQTIDARYYIEKKLGEGGFGAVYRARDEHYKMRVQQVVIKFLKEKGLDNEWVVGKFKQEAEALALLDNHPGIVGLLDAGEFRNLPYIILQYVN